MHLVKKKRPLQDYSPFARKRIQTFVETTPTLQLSDDAINATILN